MAKIVFNETQLSIARAKAKDLQSRENDYANRLNRILSKLDNSFVGIDKTMAGGWEVVEWDDFKKTSQKRMKNQATRAGSFASAAQQAIAQALAVTSAVQTDCSKINLQVDAVRASAATTTLSVATTTLSAATTLSAHSGGGRRDSAALGSAFNFSSVSKKVDVGGWFDKATLWLKNFFSNLFGQNDQTIGSGSSSSQAAQQVQVDLSGSGITTNKTYGKGDIWMISAWSGDRDKSVWPNGYTGYQGCAVASLATALSTLDIKVTPATIMSHNKQNNPEYMQADNWSGKYYGVSQVSYSMKGTDEEDLAQIDKALELYLKNPGTYSAPIISFSKGYSGGLAHFVVIYGKNEDGTYKCVDSSGNYIKSYRFVTEGYGMDKQNKVFNANLTSVRQYKKP